MAAATTAVIHFVDTHQFPGFLATFLVLFVLTGLGNGSTYRMIPTIFRNNKLREFAPQGAVGRDTALKAARIESAAVLGFVGAVAACGGYVVPRAFGASIKATGSAHLALTTFLIFYGTCICLTWACYMRRRAPEVAMENVEARV
jgi:MFS transporter, NNP family, nitrate/nitrite transporter